MKVRKYYKYGGNTPNVIIKGNPTIVNGIVSNFSRSDYLKLPKGFAPGGNTWEIVFKFTTSSLGSQSIFGNYGNTYQNAPEITITSSSKFQIAIPKNGSTTLIVPTTSGTYTVLANTTYWGKIEFTGTVYNFYYSLDGRTYMLDITATSSDTIYQAPDGFTIGSNWWDSSSNYSLLGSIDLKESYIKVNNQMWWAGTCTESDETDYDFYEDLTIYPPVKAVTEKERNYYKYGNTINATIVGSPTVANGVVSGFSSSNYLTLPQAFSTTMPWEMVFKFKMNTNFETSTILSRTESRSYNSRLTVDYTGTLGLYLSNNTSSWSICEFYTDKVITSNIWYWVKYEFTGTEYKISLSENGIDFVIKATLSNVNSYTGDLYSLGYNNESSSTYSFYFDGEMDFKKSYIKINNQLWWTGTLPEECEETDDYDFYKDTYTYKVINDSIEQTCKIFL